MTNEQKVLLKLVSATLNGVEAEIQSPEAVDWYEVALESEAQAVLPLAFDSVEKLKEHIPKDLYKAWADRAVQHLVKNAKVISWQTGLVKLLTDAGYPYVILKGLSSASYYRRPDLRVLGDVDFLIDQNHNDEITKLLCDDGYISELEDHECHTVLRKDKAHLEMHREIAGIPHGTAGELVRWFVKDLLEDCRKNADFLTPAQHHHGLILLLHTQHHMIGEGIGLRHLCDWAVFVDKTHTEPFWQEKLLPFLREIGLFTFAAVLTKTSSLAFDTACPDWADADEKLCCELLDDVISGGNFGIKEKERGLSGALITNRGKDGMEKGKWNRLYTVFRDNIKTRHPITRKYPILYPFFAIYKAIRFFVLSLFGKKTSLVQISKEMDKRKSIYKQLKIFEVTQCSKTTEN